MERLVGNRGGILYVTATQTNAGSTTTNAIYTLPDHTFRSLGSAGLMIVTIPTGTGTVTGITIQVNGQSLNLTTNLNEDIATLNAGDHLVSFNKTNNTIKLFV